MNDHFKSTIVEPRLVIFESEDFILQTFISAENDCLVEVPATTIVEGLVYLMAAYYVFNVAYPKLYQPLLYMVQDFVMDKSDNGKRPTRYASFAATITL